MSASAFRDGERLMLLDSASLYFRAYYGVPDTVTAPDGTPMNAVRGFTDMIAHLVTRWRPTHLVACWDDDWRPQWRVDAIPSYKAHRVVEEVDGTGADVEEVPDTLSPQVAVIADVLAAFGVPVVGASGCEADDVIGTLATRAVADGVGAVDVVTGDRDLFQLVDDAHQVRVLYTARGVRELTEVDEALLLEKYGVHGGDGYADMAVLRGDASDGLPGVAGIGEKTAARLLHDFRSLDGIRSGAADGDRRIAPGVRAKLQAGADYLDVAPAVVRVLRDADLPEHDETLPAEPADSDALDALVTRWGIGSSVGRLRDALAELAGPAD